MRSLPRVIVSLLLSAAALAGTPWQNEIQHPDDAFIRPGGYQEPGWVKFLILTSDPSTVYYQDSNVHAFHYDFATAELAQFTGLSPSQFDDVTLYAAGQQAILGAVLIPPTAVGLHTIPEYGIQLVRADPYSPAETLTILQTVAGSVVAGPEVVPFYMPTYEQLGVAEQNASFFETGGFPVGSVARWAEGNACYSHGWALGTLKYFAAGDIEPAFLSGQLTSEDILLTDGVPAEIPFVAGVVSLSPSTPSSHVALLAQTFDVPFTHLALAADAAEATSLVGRRVALRVRDRYSVCEVRLIDTEGELDPSTEAQLLALKAPPTLSIAADEVLGAYSVSTDGLVPSDIRYVGGKAANSGVLRQAIPESSPVSAAFSFDFWNEFLNQTMPGGLTLRQEIDQALAGFTYPPDIMQLDAALSGLRDRIEDDTTFSIPLIAAIVGTLQDPQYGFESMQNVRFRSSTNVEDSDVFTGAGLYGSFSGCLADDLDGDGSGPSRCDPGEPEERGVYRAVRKVLASFFNRNAFLERLRHGVDEDDVGMGMLIHHSFPNELELANGVGTIAQGTGGNRGGYLVLQPGAASVTNPEPGHVPEEVDVYISSFVYPTVVQPSNLLVLGETVLEHPVEYVALTELLLAATDRYETVTGLAEFVLEFEFKKIAPSDELVVTQVRRVPQPDTTPSLTPFLLNEPKDYCEFQGESGGSSLALHRLDSRWTISTDSAFLDPAKLASGFFADVELAYREGCADFVQSGPLPSWPSFAHAYAAGQTEDSFAFTDLQNPRSYRLQVPQIPELVPPSEGPFVLLSDFGWSIDYTDRGCFPLEVDYASPVPLLDEFGPPTTTSDFVMLCGCRDHAATDVLVERSHTVGDVTVETAYYWPEPVDIAAGYTAPLISFVETTITGLTSAPIVLTDSASQTYKPGHHNFTAEYVFEPALEPGISPVILDELEALDVRIVHVADNFGGALTTLSGAEWGYHCLDCRGPDADGDGRCVSEPTFDCDDAQATVWAMPGEATALEFTSPVLMRWTAPAELGSTAVVYDTLGWGPTVCLGTASSTQTLVADAPAPGSVRFYLVRAVNTCPDGTGPLGTDSSGTERTAPGCQGSSLLRTFFDGQASDDRSFGKTFGEDLTPDFSERFSTGKRATTVRSEKRSEKT